jgi:hypothetical protein
MMGRSRGERRRRERKKKERERERRIEIRLAWLTQSFFFSFIFRRTNSKNKKNQKCSFFLYIFKDLFEKESIFLKWWISDFSRRV